MDIMLKWINIAAMLFVLSLSSVCSYAQQKVEEISPMSKKMPAEKAEQLERLYQRAKVILNFIAEKQNQKSRKDDFWDDKKEELMSLWEMSIDHGYARKDIRGLKMVNNDFNELIEQYPPDDREAIYKLLDQKNLRN